MGGAEGDTFGKWCLIDVSRRALSDGASPVEKFTREVFFLEDRRIFQVSVKVRLPRNIEYIAAIVRETININIYCNS